MIKNRWYNFFYDHPSFFKLEISGESFKIKNKSSWFYRKIKYSDVKSLEYQNKIGISSIVITLKKGKIIKYRAPMDDNINFKNALDYLKTYIDPNFKMQVYIAPEHDNHKEINKVNFDFQEYAMYNLEYPEIEFASQKNELLVIEVDLKFELSEEAYPINIDIPKHKRLVSRTSQHGKKLNKTEEDVFVSKAIMLLKGFDKWKVHTYKGKYVRKPLLQTVYFTYHPNYFSTDSKIILNPDTKAIFDLDFGHYDRIINCKYGSDGVCNLIALVDEKGYFQDIQVVESGGKIGWDMAISELLKLQPLKPAVKDNKPVLSQLDIMVYI